MPKSGFNYLWNKLHIQQDAKLGCENIKYKTDKDKKEDDLVAEQ